MPDDLVGRVVVEASFAQQSLWLQHQIDPGRPTYHVPNIVRVRGELNLTVLEQALNVVVGRHEVLRTVFDTEDGSLVQVIGPAPEITVPVQAAGAIEVPGLLRAEIDRPFDLRTGPLLRLRLLRLGTQEHVAVLIMHHIVTDGMSSVLFFAELVNAYQALLAGEAPELTEPPIQYADFAAWQRLTLRGEHLDRLTAYWRNTLAGALPAALPRTRPRRAVPPADGEVHRFVLPGELIAGLERVAARQGGTLFMVLLAGLDVLLMRYSRQLDITVAAPIAGRSRPELQNVLGFFINPVLLRADLSDDPTFVELLGRVRTACLGAFEHQDMPFELVSSLLPANTAQAFVQVRLVLQNMGRPNWQAAGLTLEPMEVDTGTAKADLLLDVEPGPEFYRARLEYRTDLLDALTVQRMAVNLVTVLTELAGNPQQPISRPTVLSAEERRLQLADWNSPARALEPPGRQVAERAYALAGGWSRGASDAPAVFHAGQEISYAELDRRAAAVAAALRESGVRSSSVLALALPPGADLAVAVVAALRAGAGFLALDIADPPDYLDGQIAASGAAFVIGDIESAAATVVGWTQLAGGSTRDLPAVCPAAGCERTPALSFALTTTAQSLSGARRTAAALGLTAADRCLIAAAHPQSLAVQLLPVLAAGAAVVLPEPGTPFRVTASARHATVASVQAAWLPGLDPADLPTVRQLVTGPLRAPGLLIPPAWQDWPGELVTLYHLPEVAGAAIVQPRASRALGCPRYLLDSAMRPVPVGAIGELYVGGTTVALGYGGEPSRTAASFLPDPFGAAGGRLVRTGELARYRTDGSVDLLGRAEDLAEITGELVSVTPGAGEPHAAQAPRTPFEEEVARIWAELLGVPAVGIHQDFFELGGQSLIAVRLTARLRDEFGVELTVRELYDNFTVAEVAWLLLTRMTGADSSSG